MEIRFHYNCRCWGQVAAIYPALAKVNVNVCKELLQLLLILLFNI